MKARHVVVGAVAALMVGAAAPVFAQPQSVAGDSIIDKAGDWLATLGKSKTDKQIILADRHTKRIARRMSHVLEKTNHEAEEEIANAGQGVEKGLSSASGQ